MNLLKSLKIFNDKPKEDYLEKANQIINHLSSEKDDLEEILQSIQNGVISINLQGYITFVNRKALEILKTAEIIVKNKHINTILPLDNQSFQNAEFEVKLRNFAGNPIIVKVARVILKSDQGELNGAFLLLNDITEEKEFTAMKLDFVSLAVHQLRTPLTVVRSYLSVLNGMINDKLNDEERLFLSRASIGAYQLMTLIENLLSVSKIEHGKLKINLISNSIEKIIEEVIDRLKDIAYQKRVRISFDKPNIPMPPIIIDPNMISIALTNLITNAIQYNYPDGVVIINMQSDRSSVTIHISDHGRGIPAEAVPHIFSQFFRVSEESNPRSQGTGLGLYITKSIIDAHHGKIWFNSIEGIGTTFSFTLPIIQPIDQPV